MITSNEIFPIGQIHKPHGLQGELSCSFTNTVFDDAEAPYFVVEMDNIFVPFFLESYRFKTDTTALVKLQDVENEIDANRMSNKTIYLPNEYLEQTSEENATLQDLVGFDVIDVEKGSLGTISEVDESTMNVLLVLNDGALLIPANDAFVEHVDYPTRKIIVKIPDELLQL